MKLHHSDVSWKDIGGSSSSSSLVVFLWDPHLLSLLSPAFSRSPRHPPSPSRDPRMANEVRSYLLPESFEVAIWVRRPSLPPFSSFSFHPRTRLTSLFFLPSRTVSSSTAIQAVGKHSSLPPSRRNADSTSSASRDLRFSTSILELVRRV